MPYTPIIGCLGYVLSPDRKQVLLVHRTARAGDDHLGKYNGLGGKLEATEDIVSCMRREMREEASIECLKLRLRGTINWTNFGPHGEDWLGFVFLVESFRGQVPPANEEGRLDWHPLDQLAALPMWEGDRYFLSLVFDDDERCFHGYMPYDGQRPLSFHYERI